MSFLGCCFFWFHHMSFWGTQNYCSFQGVKKHEFISPGAVSPKKFRGEPVEEEAFAEWNKKETLHFFGGVPFCVQLMVFLGGWDSTSNLMITWFPSIPSGSFGISEPSVCNGFPWWFGARWFGFRLDLPENESGIVTFSGYPETRMRKPTKRPGPHQGKPTYLERQVSYFLGNFTPKTSNYCLKNRALVFPGS